MSSSNNPNKPLSDVIRDALVEVYNNCEAGWHEFECAALSAIAGMSTEIAQQTALMEAGADAMDVDGDDDDNDDDDDHDDDGDDDNGNPSSPGSGDLGGSSHHDAQGRSIYRCPFPQCSKPYKATRTRARHIRDKHPNQPVPPFNDP